MILVVSDAALAELLASSVLLAQLWPGAAAQEVKLLMHILRVSVPSLAEALAVGLVKLDASSTHSDGAEVLLAFKTAVLRAIALDREGRLIGAPHGRLADVIQLDIVDLSVAGCSALRMAG
jgi:hypothetical protein